MAKEIDLFKAGRPGEYVAIFTLPVTNEEGPLVAYLGCDAFSESLFHTGYEINESSENIIKHVYLLTHDKTFLRYKDEGFTIVLDKFEEVADRIEANIKPFNGRLLCNKAFHRRIVNRCRVRLMNLMLAKRK